MAREEERKGLLSYLSVGAIVIVAIAVLSTAVVMSWPVPVRKGLEFWIFARVHEETYGGPVKRWNDDAPAEGLPPVKMLTVTSSAMVRRTLSAFWAGTPVADVMEVERAMIGQFVSGPLEDVGFVDLTDRLKAEGIYETINRPSFAVWTSRGRIFGIPHDVHPTVLAYRADIAGELGIDMGSIETWADFAHVTRPMVRDVDGDGTPDCYPLGFWYTDTGLIEVLLLQAGGGTFAPDGRSLIACEANARVVATLIGWCFGPGRLAIDAPEFSASGNKLRLDGNVACTIMPDWLAGVYRQDMPQLAGKWRAIPLPAWEPGGRRTSVMGGTMMAIPKCTKQFDVAWRFAKHLYLSEEVARRLYEHNTILSPVRSMWTKDFYRKPDPYFGGQAIGPLLISLAPNVPMRTSSPFRNAALQRIGEAVNALKRIAVETDTYDPESLLPDARRLLKTNEELVLREMRRNVFLQEDGR